jgi:NAD+ synthase
MPCHGDAQDEADARLVVDHFELPSLRIDLSPTIDVLAEDLIDALHHVPADQRLAPAVEDEGRERSSIDVRARSAMANVKPRLRMTALYFLANSLGYLVAGTGNRCELAVGYFTKHGDGGVDLLPIGELLKSDVRAAARALGVPAAVIEKTPSAGLWPGQTDEADLGFSYAALERYLTDGPEAVAPALAMRLERLMRQSEHKRAMPPRHPEPRS